MGAKFIFELFFTLGLSLAALLLALKYLPETGVANPKTRLALRSSAHPKDGPTLTQPRP